MSVAECEMGQGLPVAITMNDPIHRLIALLPRPMRFFGVGALGLATDFGVFTIIAAHGFNPLWVRLISLGCATLVTWRLNRAFTFDRSGRPQGHEAMRYAAVTALAQGTSYVIFAALVLTLFGGWPQVALLIGAAVAAAVSYNGHRLFAFAPRTASAPERVNS